MAREAAWALQRGTPRRLTAMASYPISRPAGVCAATGAPIGVGERFVAALVEREESEELERQDFSERAWREGARPAAPLRVFACWRAAMPAPGAKPRTILLGDDELLDLFEQLGEAEEPRRQAFRYLLALLLIRKKLLRYEGQRPGVLLVRRKGEGPELPAVEILDPGSASEALGAAIEQLGEIMDLGAAASGTGQAV